MSLVPVPAAEPGGGESVGEACIAPVAEPTVAL